MKKPIFVLTLCLLILQGCSKDYVCKCHVTETTTNGSVNTTISTTNNKTVTGKKDEASASCAEYSGTTMNGNTTYSSSCEIIE